MKTVQISQELFMKLLQYHLLDDNSCADDVDDSKLILDEESAKGLRKICT